MKKILIVLLLGIFKFSFANGSPTAIGYNLAGGNIIYIKDNSVICQREDLKISPKYTQTKVSVRYELKNTSNSKHSVRYSFPIANLGISWLKRNDMLNKINYSIKVNGKIVEWRQEWGESTYSYKSYYDYKNHTDTNRIALYTSELNFAPQEMKVIEIDYTQPHYFEMEETYPSLLSDVDHYFGYFLHTGGNWKFGIIKDFYLDIDFSYLLEKGKQDAINKLKSGYTTPNWLSEEIKSSGKVDSSHLMIHKKDYKPTREDDIYLSISDGPLMNTLYYKSQNKLLQKMKIKKIEVSSTLKNYPASFAFDGKLDTAWVENNPEFGEGEWISIEFENSIYIDSLSLVNGYLKTKDLFYKNNQLKKILITCFKGTEKILTKTESFSTNAYEIFNTTNPVNIVPGSCID
ncbi:MAG: DUF4424 family protein, partial [Spirochaetes bacterium]|nr:DUF4424 family protein [Spirochaetota bacterium]